MFLCAASQRHCLLYALALFPTLIGTGPFCGKKGCKRSEALPLYRGSTSAKS